jgi:2'-5' RNA ligase
MTRRFIGFMLPENVKDYVEGVKGSLSELPIDCKLIEKDNLHICFSFLGDVENLDEIKNELDKVAQEFSKVEVSVDGIKAIPNERYIRVLVLDVNDESGVLNQIQREICKRIGGDGKPLHITLCRVRNVSNKDAVLRKIEEMKDKKGGTFTVNSVQLIESVLSRSGPKYTVVHESTMH